MDLAFEINEKKAQNKRTQHDFFNGFMQANVNKQWTMGRRERFIEPFFEFVDGDRLFGFQRQIVYASESEIRLKCIEANKEYLPLKTYGDFKTYEEKFNNCYKDLGQGDVEELKSLDNEFAEMKK